MGRGGPPGGEEGPAYVVRTAADLQNVPSGAVIVARHATADLFPALTTCAAAVCETAGVVCHLAVLARELSNPCAPGLPGVVNAIRTGEAVRADGTRGLTSCPANGG